MVDKIMLDISKLMEMEEFESFMTVIEGMEKDCDNPCEYYCEHPEMAHVDKGRKIAFYSIKNYLSNVKSIVGKDK